MTNYRNCAPPGSAGTRPSATSLAPVGRRLPSGIAATALAILLATHVSPAAAGPRLSAQEILGTYNLITTGDVATNSSIQGSAVIGGNLSGTTFFNGNTPSNPGIYLYGSQSGNLNLNNGGSLYMNGTPGGRVNYNGGGHLDSSGPPQPLTQYTSPLTQLSTQLAGMSQTMGNTLNGGTFTAAAGVGGMSVFNITGAALQSALTNANINFGLGSGVTGVLVNVTGNFTEPNGANWNNLAQNVMFNFVDATSVTVGNWQSSILAPNATLAISNGSIGGSVFASQFVGGGEIRNYLYNGSLPSLVSTDTPGEIVATPEPATLTIVGLGLAATALLRRRRRATDAALIPVTQMRD